jgi:hypothetical protein
LLRAREIARQPRENPPPLAIAVFYRWRISRQIIINVSRLAEPNPAIWLRPGLPAIEFCCNAPR